MFDLCSDTESAKTIKQLRDVVDSLSARLRTGGLRSQQSASDVQAPTPFFQLRTFLSIRQHGRHRNRMGRVRGERAGVAPNQ